MQGSDGGPSGAATKGGPKTAGGVLDETKLSLAEIQAALGKDFLTDQMLDVLVSRKQNPAAVLRRARGKFSQAVRARSFGPVLGKWVLTEHPAGFWIWVKLGDGVSNAILRGGYDQAVTDIVRGFLKPGGTFLDVGANVGWYTMVAASYFATEGGRVLAFEPQRELFDHVVRSLAQNGFERLVTAHNCALGDRDGPIQMLDAGLNSGGSFVIPAEKRRDSFEDARMARLDGLGPVSGRVDAIKLDIEGAEPMFFAGAKAFFARERPPIVSEVNVRKLRAVSNVAAPDYVRSVLSLGYEVSAIRPEGGLAPLEWDKAEDERQSFNVLFSPV